MSLDSIAQTPLLTITHKIDLDGKYSVTLHTTKPKLLATSLQQSTMLIAGVHSESVSVRFNGTNTFTDPPAPVHLNNSFVVDFNEPSVIELVAEIKSIYGNNPTPTELILFVDKTISTKTYSRGFDLASTVADRKEGDCTEHAVLLAALARAFKKPAKIVFGVLLLVEQKTLISVGHAWVEIFDGSTWRISDATRPELRYLASQYKHIPLSKLANESSGYTMDILATHQLLPHRVVGQSLVQ